jgi:hypothetical protein
MEVQWIMFIDTQLITASQQTVNIPIKELSNNAKSTQEHSKLNGLLILVNAVSCKLIYTMGVQYLLLLMLLIGNHTLMEYLIIVLQRQIKLFLL